MPHVHGTPSDGFFAAWLGKPSAGQRAAIGAQLDQVRGALVAAWPEGPPREAAYWAELARCVPDDVDDAGLADALARVSAVELHLAFCCRHGDAPALGRFERGYMAAQAGAIARIDANPAFVDEVLQRVRMKLLVADDGDPPKLAHYTGKGPLQTWLRVVAVREALTLLASQRRDVEVSDEELLALDAGGTGPEAALLQQQYRAEFRAALEEALAGLEPAERNLLRLHYLHGLTIDELGRLLDVHRSSAARRIVKCRENLLAATRRALFARVAVGRAEFDQLMALVASRWDLSIERFLGATAEP